MGRCQPHRHGPHHRGNSLTQACDGRIFAIRTIPAQRLGATVCEDKRQTNQDSAVRLLFLIEFGSTHGGREKCRKKPV